MRRSAMRSRRAAAICWRPSDRWSSPTTPARAKSGAECRTRLCVAMDIARVRAIDKQGEDEDRRPGLTLGFSVASTYVWGNVNKDKDKDRRALARDADCQRPRNRAVRTRSEEC